jgi:cephalosporin-C deacetylase
MSIYSICWSAEEILMPYTDLPLDALHGYAPAMAIPEDLETFWATTLAETRVHPLEATFKPIGTDLTAIDTFDVSFAGFGGAPIKAWLHLPVARSGRLPAVVEYDGYGGGRGLPHEQLLWPAAGYAHLIMDMRGQGSAWSAGVTPDPEATGEPSHPGSMTQGILDPASYYYRRVFSDAVRAIEAVRTHPSVDAERIAAVGGSQGGGIALAVAGLTDGLAAVVPDVPFLCDVPRALRIADTDPYGEVVRYLKVHRDQVDRVLGTLAYFDGAILGRTATAPALFSVGLMDTVCPPSTVYAAFNHYGGPKEIREYPFNGHEGGQGFHDAVKLHWLRERLGD